MHGAPSDLDALVDEALTQSRATGLDALSATRQAVRAVRAARPDLTPDEAWAAVELVVAERCAA